MKKVARLRMPQDVPITAEPAVRTTGRIKKPKAVFDPSDNYLPRSARINSTAAAETKSAFTPATSSPSLTVAAGGVSGGSPVDMPETAAVQQQHQQQRLSSRSSGSGSIGNTPSNTSTANFPETSTNDACCVCLKREGKRGIGAAKNKLITCLDCEKRVHKLCLKLDFENLETLRQNYKCGNCRTCDVCDTFSDIEAKLDSDFVTCTKCVKSYHLTCHIPNVRKFQQFQKDWKCNKCSSSSYGGSMQSGGIDMLPVKAIREIMGAVEPPAKTSKSQQSVNIAAAAAEAKTVAAAVKRKSQELQKNVEGAVTNGRVTVANNNKSESEQKNSKCEVDPLAAAVPNSSAIANTGPSMRYSPNEPTDVPDVKYWNVSQVAEYFAKYFPNEAHVFKDQEIDGMSLLLLKRSDVIKKLPIKLGPSLRIYSLILKIQTQLNDPTLGWNCGL